MLILPFFLYCFPACIFEYFDTTPEKKDYVKTLTDIYKYLLWQKLLLRKLSKH